MFSPFHQSPRSSDVMCCDISRALASEVALPGKGSKRNDKFKTYVHKDLLTTPEWEDIQERFGLSALGTTLKRHEAGGKQMTVLDQAFHSGGPNGDEHMYANQSQKKSEGAGAVVRAPQDSKKRKRRKGGGAMKKRSGEESKPAGEKPGYELCKPSDAEGRNKSCAAGEGESESPRGARAQSGGTRADTRLQSQTVGSCAQPHLGGLPAQPRSPEQVGCAATSAAT
ncbi:hypothetical protein KFL_000670350 [Klebsormidium nitens]|uniref:Uncharacterized protein n=1 Tax=Klebsormidium nitens TaxID=105231 RepID=A0A1Y1HWS5_KLENI|nr:hypothetical protein KFL_000670350 [Klebsormidium nitens]|eukprot:GAQ80977.1 hypothetical protein KFL_000670350 [Klebsormidium nitens]